VRLYEDGVFPTPDGRARFVDTPYKPVAEAREARYPFSLNTGRLRDQWHGMSRTGTSAACSAMSPSPWCRCIRRTWRGARSAKATSCT
jgi:assimilatory nitrate reductase catalytic subunit